MKCPSPLLYFIAEPDTPGQDPPTLASHAERCESCQGIQRDAGRFTKLLHKVQAPVLSTCPDSINLARYLQGSLTSTERSDFTEHLTECDSCLAELAFALRGHALAPVSPALARRLQSMFQGSPRRGSQSGRLARGQETPVPVAEPAPPAPVRARAKTERRSRRLGSAANQAAVPRRSTRRRSQASAELFGQEESDTASAPEPAPEPAPEAPPVAPPPPEFETQPLSLETILEAGEQAAAAAAKADPAAGSLAPAAKAPQGSPDGAPSKRSRLARPALYALIGAGAIFVVAVVPFFGMSKELFVRARRAEIDLAKARKTLGRLREDSARLAKRNKAMEEELRRRPTRAAYERQRQTHKILSDGLRRANRAREQAIQRHQKALAELKERATAQLAGADQRLAAERARHPDRLYASISGSKEGAAPDNATLIEQLQSRDDQVGVASFYLLEHRGLGVLAVALAQRRPKLSLMRFLSRPYIAAQSRDGRLAHLISYLLSPEDSVRQASMQLLEDEGLDLFGYEADQEPERRNVHVAAIVARWQESFGRPFPLPLSFAEDDEGRWRSSDKR